MAEDAPTPKTPLDAFREAFREDLENDAIRPLADYVVRFPGDDAAIAREYRAFKERGASATVSSTQAGDHSADRIAHYRIVQEIGRGGQGIVYLAEDTRLRRKVALKVLKGMDSLSEDSLARFRREAEAASRLDHPGICAVYEAALDGKVPYIAMRLVEGKSLAAKIASAKSVGDPSTDTSCVHVAEIETAPGAKHRPGTDPSPTPSGPTTRADIMRVVQLIEKVARALHAAHEAGVIHRDMKPGNVMVTPEGEAVIMDFGLAHLEDDQLPTLTQTGELFGTPAYMSPEQLLAQRVRLDRRTDVWSLGVMLYECVTLARPFDAPTREGMYQAIQTKQPLDPRRINRSVPEEIGVVIETALEKDRDRRYQTALDFAEELRRVRCFEPLEAKPAGPALRFRRWAQRSPVLATAVGGVFAVLVVGLAVALFLLGERDRALDEKDKALEEKEAAVAEKGKALDEVTLQRNENADWARLGEFMALHTLIGQADTLWPIAPTKVADMKAWMQQAESLGNRLPDHKKSLETLRTRALPLTEREQEAEHRANDGNRNRLDFARKERDALASDLAAQSRAATRAFMASRPDSGPGTGPSPEKLRAQIAKLDEEIEALETRVHERRTWRFGSFSDQFKHDSTERLIQELTTFVDPTLSTGSLADVAARLKFAESLETDANAAEKETVVRYARQWSDAIRSIADKSECPEYGGLRIIPQAGLVPIGRDPVSGLWEFAHFQTTASGTDPVPTRDESGRLIITESTGLVFVLLPGATFRMGAIKPDKDHPAGTANVDPDASSNESPIADVPLDPFFMSKYEMTQGQWLRATGGRDPSYFGAPVDAEDRPAALRQPVESVSWYDCDRWLPRVGLVLPTEAQWEYAARGGTTTVRWTGNETDGVKRAARFDSANVRQVGSLLPNAFGFHDVLGNVSEWCRDGYVYYTIEPSAKDGLRNEASGQRVARGGGWSSKLSEVRSAHRESHVPETRDQPDLGVRPARACRR